ncbi:hypothetical protein E4T39_03398 [Aureobasidium subglaciale]|nr:hypothetical protein E4T39_03398 [Aureobasidium subglaciale]
MDMPNNCDGWNELQRITSSPSAPTTPRTKRKIHFIEPSPEDIAPRRSNTVPPGFRTSSTIAFDREQPLSGGPDTEEIQPDLISFEEPEEMSEKSQDLSDVCLESHEGDPDFYDMDVEMVTYDDDSTPIEELLQVSLDEDDAERAKDRIIPLRHAKSQSVSDASGAPQERPGPPIFYRTSSASGLYSKPAYSPIVKAHVAASPVRFEFCTTPDSDEQLDDIPQSSRSQTASSKSSNSASSALWDDKVAASTGERPGPPSETSSPSAHTRPPSDSRGEFPLEAVKRKLSAMSHMRRSSSNKHSKRQSPEPLSSPDEMPAAPPNTRAASDTPKRSPRGPVVRHSHSGASSPKVSPMLTVRSEPQSPTQSTRVSPHLKPALKQRGPSKPVATAKSHDRFVPNHRDSLELARHRLAEEAATVDPQLVSTRDSIILAKQRWDKYPKSHAVFDAQPEQMQFGGLSPIMDASPPDPKAYWAGRREHLLKQKEVDWQREIGGHPENDHDCPICEVEKPRTKRLASLRAG